MTDEHDERTTLNTPAVQDDWTQFLAKVAAGEVEEVDLDDYDPPEDATEDFHNDTLGLLSSLAAPAALAEVSTLAGYDEHASAAIKTLNKEMTRIGAENLGAVGNSAHLYGYHLSPIRLRGTGHSGDYSLSGVANNPIADQRAACAQDIGMGWKASRQWIKWLFGEYTAGRLPHVVEIIGAIDGRTALYAATSIGRKVVKYTGTGHVAWSHVAHGRRYANVSTYGAEVLGKWDATGPKTTQKDVTELRSVVAACQLPDGRDAVAVLGTDFKMYLAIDDGPFHLVKTEPKTFDPGLTICPLGATGVVIGATDSKEQVCVVHVRDVNTDTPRAAVIPPVPVPGSCKGAPGLAVGSDGKLRMTLVGTNPAHSLYRAVSTGVDVNGVIQWTPFVQLTGSPNPAGAV